MLLPYFNEKGIEVGCDEAGRGPLAGPVFAAAVIWPKDLLIPEIDDSKKLSEKKRNALRPFIEKNAIAWSVAQVDEKEIDEINILNASIKAMHLALDGIDIRFSLILVDGNRFKDYETIDHRTIVKGDGKYLSIAASSILAKTYRDDYMLKIDKEFPEYLWKNNKGYPTKYHIEMVRKRGVSMHHRMTFSRKFIAKL